MHRIVVELMRDEAGALYFRARDEQTGREGESDHIMRFDVGDVHARFALAAQAVTRLGELIEAGR